MENLCRWETVDVIPMKSESKWYFTAIPVFLITFLTVNASVLSMVDGKLRDGSVMEFGRYHFTFDAYNHIRADESPSVVAWGSSKMREAFNGNEFEEFSVHPEASFYNLAFAAERPYYRLPEVASLIAADPEVLMLELGPNTFSSLKTPLDASSLERMNSILFHRPLNDDTDFEKVLDAEDKALLELGLEGRLSASSRYAFPALENKMVDRFADEPTGWSCDEKMTNVRCVPPPGTPLFDAYLRQPPQFSNYIERAKVANDGTLEEFYGERLDKYIQSTYHNPQGTMNKNHRAFDYIIEQARGAGIDVVLVAIPYNPVFMDRLSASQWDYYYAAIENYSLREDITTIDLSRSPHFSNDEYFNDYSHMAELGESQFTRLVLPSIDQILTQRLGNTSESANYPAVHVLPAMEFDVQNETHISIAIGSPTISRAGSGSFSGHSWVVQTSNEVTSIVVEPNTGQASKDITTSPHLRYCFSSPSVGDKYLWIRSDSPDFNSDSVWLGNDGNLIDTGERGVGLKSSVEGKVWFSQGDNGERLVFPTVEGSNCLDIWMREDGVAINELILTSESGWSPEA